MENIGDSGNRGALLESWTSADSLDALSTSVAGAGSTRTLDEWQWSDSVSNDFVSRTRAFFVPPSDNDYQFNVTTEGDALVRLNPTSDLAAQVGLC